jgi:hypothetical protein
MVAAVSRYSCYYEWLTRQNRSIKFWIDTGDAFASGRKQQLGGVGFLDTGVRFSRSWLQLA